MSSETSKNKAAAALGKRGGKVGGQAKSPAKTAAARANGAKGGRPASPVLHLVLTHHWYDETEQGAKRTEYRAMTERWKRQIWDRRESITAVRFARGYTSRTLTRSVESIDIGPCPIPGWDGDYYRVHFSADHIPDAGKMVSVPNTQDQP